MVSLIARFFPCPRGCSSAGRAPALQAGGQRFEPAHLHQHIDNRIGLSRSPECRKAKGAPKNRGFFGDLNLDPLSKIRRDLTRILQRLKSGYRSNKLVRVRGGCLGTKSRRKTRLPAISIGELEANDDPVISEWGNPLEVMLEHPWLNTRSRWRAPGELKHLSTRRKRDSLSRGDRKGSSLNRVRVKPAGVARAVSWDRLSSSAELERS